MRVSTVVAAALLGLAAACFASPALASEPDPSDVVLHVRIAPVPAPAPECGGGRGCPGPELAATGADLRGALLAGTAAIGGGIYVRISAQRRGRSN
ncbi:hypothetical protein [Arthrobacter sp. 35W]|uniref:hypothetical protein n=1 Tax=Arthrobacter sp. 35W TaxID=1132441 RepID=UPI000404D161|nr:hypothetical protein [Arthrobacter sp. 35W]